MALHKTKSQLGQQEKNRGKQKANETDPTPVKSNLIVHMQQPHTHRQTRANHNYAMLCHCKDTNAVAAAFTATNTAIIVVLWQTILTAACIVLQLKYKRYDNTLANYFSFLFWLCCLTFAAQNKTSSSQNFCQRYSL